MVGEAVRNTGLICFNTNRRRPGAAPGRRQKENIYGQKYSKAGVSPG